MIEALKATGVFRAFVPQRFGGYEIDLDLFVDIGVAVSEACASTGWITTFYMEHNWLLGMFARRAAGGGVLARSRSCSRPGSVNPKDGTATPKGDGYELTGHWKFGTGIVHADWVLLSGAHRDRADARCRACSWCGRDDVEVRDTWHVDGMVATGSHDIVASAVLVPERHVSLREPLGAPRARTRPTWRASRSRRCSRSPRRSRARRRAARGRAVPASDRASACRSARSKLQSQRAPGADASRHTRSPTCARPRPCCAPSRAT